MGATPDELRQDADTARADLARTADRLAEKLSPQKAARRQTQAARQRLGTVKDRVMGTAKSGPAQLTSRTGDTVRDTREQVGQQVRQAPEQLGQKIKEAPGAVRSQTQGSPLAAGLVAFGAGLLAGGLFPATPPEERAGRRIREHSEEWAQPVKETVREAAEGVREELREPVREAAESVKGTAQEAARSTKEETRRAGDEGARRIKGQRGPE
ncbi:DUF3618 domain-containing protein [Streptomyces sp. SYP-A7185]|uniref:DUF3618 domain-containing protein n=1 Tax=Streptomyces sp. SYP-A7185 TaxID=3040076 RepID=UPI0038F6A0A3